MPSSSGSAGSAAPSAGGRARDAVGWATGPPTAVTAWTSGTPEPSRRESGTAGSATGTPLGAAATGGAAPAQARISPSSPLSSRWQRTPPVARPLPGYSANGVTLTVPASVPGSAPDDPATVTTT